MPVARSQRELDDALREVTGDRVWRRMVEPWLSSYGVDTDHNQVAVGLTHIPADVAARTHHRFGDQVRLEIRPRANDLVDRTAHGPTGHRRAPSRKNESAPWDVGIPIDTPVGRCTTGPIIYNPQIPQDRRIVTAGHCINKDQEAFHNPTGGGHARVGAATWSQNGNGQTDLAFIHGEPYANWVYLGPPTSNYGRVLVGLKPALKGWVYCPSGQTTGEHCNAKVETVRECIKVRGVPGEVCNLTRTSSTDGNPTSDHGDSGGPASAYFAQELDPTRRRS